MSSFFSEARIAAALVAVALSLASPIADACTSTSECNGGSVCSPTKHLCVGCFDNTPCFGPSPICDVSAGFCSSCDSDFGGSGSLPCTSAHPVCITSGPQTGECVDCSATNKSACTTITRPVCSDSLSKCGCNADSDCDSSTYCDHDVAPEGWCVFGCHVIGGVDRCPAGNHCDARDGSIGNCRTGMCGTDPECGATDSGKICAGGTCVDGCRGTNGNGCAASLVCSSSDDTSGTCQPPVVTPDAGPTHDASAPMDAGADVDADAPIVAAAGFGGCSASPSSPDSSAGLFAVLAAALGIAAMRARRATDKRRACATPPSPSSIPK